MIPTLQQNSLSNVVILFVLQRVLRLIDAKLAFEAHRNNIYFQALLPCWQNEIRTALQKRERGLLNDEETRRKIRCFKRSLLSSDVKNEIGKRLSRIQKLGSKSELLTEHLRITCEYLLPN